MNENIVESIVKYAKMLEADRLTGEDNCISLRVGSKMLITKQAAKFAVLTADEVLELDFTANMKGEALRHADIYKARPDINCVMHTLPFNACTCANAAITIPPILDDMSQIVGANIKTARSGSAKSIVKALKGRNACLLDGEGMISSGRSLDEAYTACLVLEKAAKTFIEATALGGAVKLGLLDANLQRLIYKKKYSKANQDAKMEEVNNG